MAKYAEGNPVILPVTNTAVSSTTMIAADTQLAAMLGPNDWVLPLNGVSASNWVGSGADSDPPYMSEPDAAEKTLIISLPMLREGMKILEIDLLLGGQAEGTETNKGEIVLRRVPIADATSKSDVDTFSPDDSNDVWERGGVGPFKENWDGISHTVLADNFYYLAITSVGDGQGGDECYYYGGIIRCQFGN